MAANNQSINQKTAGCGSEFECTVFSFCITGAEATKALAVAARWLPEPEAPDSRRTTESDTGDAAAAENRDGDSGAGNNVAATGAEEQPLANGQSDAAEEASSRGQHNSHASEANGDAMPSGNFETMTFHVGGELALLLQNS